MIEPIKFEGLGGWMGDFAKKSREIGRAVAKVGELSQEEEQAAKAAWKEAGRMLGGSDSALSRLHSIILWQAAAEVWAAEVESSDLSPRTDASSGVALGRDLVASMMRMRMGENLCEDASIACMARLGEMLCEKFPDMQIDVVLKAVVGFAPIAVRPWVKGAAQDALLGAEGNAKERARLDQRHGKQPPFVQNREEEAEIRGFLLSRTAGSCPAAGLLEDALRRMWTDEGHAPEGRALFQMKVMAFDNERLLADFPTGLHDGAIMLLPLRAIGAAFGGAGAVERAMSTLRWAARAVLGFEKGEGAPVRIPPGSMGEELIARGLAGSAGMLCRGELEKSLLESGAEAGSVGEAIKRACLEGSESAAPDDAEEDENGLDDQLRSAAWQGASSLVEKLLQAGANPKSQSRLGVTALMLAAAAKNKSLVARLIPLSSLSAVDCRSMSALHHAASQACEECCRLLAPLASGSKKNCDGLAPWELAKRGMGEELSHWLADCAAAVDERMVFEGALESEEAALARPRGPAKQARL